LTFLELLVDGVVVCLLAASHKSSGSLIRAVNGCTVRCGIISSMPFSTSGYESYWCKNHYSKCRTSPFIVTFYMLGQKLIKFGFWQSKNYFDVFTFCFSVL